MKATDGNNGSKKEDEENLLCQAVEAAPPSSFKYANRDILLENFQKETVKSGTRRITPKICSSSGELSRSSYTISTLPKMIVTRP
jgi:hypothetical protein